MTSIGIVVGLLLGVPFGILLGGLLEANGEDGVATDLPLGPTAPPADHPAGSSGAPPWRVPSTGSRALPDQSFGGRTV
jgi:hypothetical protein